MAADCLFCRICAGDVPATRLHDDDLVVAIRDINPQAPTHVLVLPKEHIPSAADLGETHGALLGRIFAVAADLARGEGLVEHGYRVVTNVGAWGGQSVDHLHFHVIGGRQMGWPPGVTGRRGGSASAVLVVAVLVAAVSVGCGIAADADATPVTFPPASFGPSASVSPDVEQTRERLVRAFSAAGYQVVDPQQPFRPAELPRFAAAPRRVIQVLLARDLDHGRISIYDFSTAVEAEAAGREQADYVASGIGNVQFPVDTQFVIRQVGSTVVFYAWSPENSPDPRTAGIADVLRTVGTEIPSRPEPLVRRPWPRTARGRAGP